MTTHDDTERNNDNWTFLGPDTCGHEDETAEWRGDDADFGLETGQWFATGDGAAAAACAEEIDASAGRTERGLAASLLAAGVLALTVLLMGLAGGGCATIGDGTDGTVEAFTVHETTVFAPAAPPAAQDGDDAADDGPQTVTVYTTVEGEPALRMDVMAEALALPYPADASGADATDTVSDGERALTQNADGTAEYIDRRFVPGDEPIQALTEKMVWDAAKEMLEDCHAVEHGPMQLLPEAIAYEQGPVDSPTAGPGETALTMHTATFEQRIDGMPSFGAGSRVEVQVPGDDFVVAMTLPIRNLEAYAKGEPMTTAEAIKNWMERAAQGGEWNLLAQGDGAKIVQVDVAGTPELGYHVPAAGSASQTVEPVYHLEGVAIVEDDAGNLQTIEFQWFEPALEGRPVPQA